MSKDSGRNSERELLDNCSTLISVLCRDVRLGQWDLCQRVHTSVTLHMIELSMMPYL